MVYLLPGASFSLAPGVSYGGSELHDVDGSSYPLNAQAQLICSRATKPVEFESMCDGIAEHFDSDHERTRDDVRKFVIDLHQRGLISVQQPFGIEALVGIASAIPHLSPRNVTSMLDIGRFRLFRRYRPTVGGVLRTVVEAYQTIAWLGVLMVVAGVVVVLAVSPSVGVLLFSLRAICIVIPSLLLIFLGSIYVHELGHLAAAKWSRTLIYSTFTASGIAGISYHQRRPGIRAAIAVAGPLASIVFLAVIAATIAWSPGTFWAETTFDGFRLSILAVIVTFAAWQLLAFTPISTDGRMLLRMIRTRS
jgi:hypothetical protein